MSDCNIGPHYSDKYNYFSCYEGFYWLIQLQWVTGQIWFAEGRCEWVGGGFDPYHWLAKLEKYANVSSFTSFLKASQDTVWNGEPRNINRPSWGNNKQFTTILHMLTDNSVHAIQLLLEE